jgi:Flp pilus assembly protein TadG
MRDLIARLTDTIRRLAVCRRGGPAVEMGIVLPVLILMIIGTVYASWMIYSTTMLYYAVQSAARCAAVNANTCGGKTLSAQITAVQNYAVTQAQQVGLNVTTGIFAVSQPANGCGWQVTATYPFTFVLPFQTSNPSYNITLSACYPAQV